MVGKAVLKLIDEFSGQGHSGFSAGMVAAIFTKLAAWEPLTPLTDDPAEWQYHDDATYGGDEGKGIWQSRRRPSAFSSDGGKTYHLLEDREERYEQDGVSWTRSAPKSKWPPLRRSEPAGKRVREWRVDGDLYSPHPEILDRVRIVPQGWTGTVIALDNTSPDVLLDTGEVVMVSDDRCEPLLEATGRDTLPSVPRSSHTPSSS